MGKRTKRQTINIPQEIVEEILYNLPVKSLSRFKCVSKQWRSLISGKDFVKQHLKRSSNTDHDSTDGFTDRHKLIFIFKYDQNRRLGLGSCSLRDEPTITPSYDNHPMGDSGLRTIVIVGSCNGLVLVNNIHMTNLVLLWNPSTRKVKHIRPPSLDDDDEARAHYGPADMRFIYGLGYDETSDDYKVVCTKVSNHHHTYHTQMYSSKTDSWKKIQNFNKGFPGYHYSAKFVNGRFHWLAHRDRRIRGPRDIVSLRLSDEKYESVAQPSCFSNFNYDSHTLMLENLGGYLSLMSITAEWDVDVWAMMEYGKRESWTKIWTFSDFVDNFDRRLASGMPLCLNKNGDIAVAFGSDVVVYNGKKEVRKSRVDMLHAIAGSVVYVESLVSPFGIDDEQ